MLLTEYITIDGDCWDSIAFKAYGNATNFGVIQDANPNIPMYASFSGGIKILIPIMEVVESTIKDLLPPWKRVDSTLAQKQIDIQNIQSNNSNISTGSFDLSFD